jgi:serine phosphatase RsbU (regulator of sigma subunit)
MPDIAKIIQKAFPGISATDVESMKQAAEVQTYPPGYVLCHEGEIERVFYILAEGEVAITHKLPSGGVRFFGSRYPGEFFGEMALIENKPRAASITTSTVATVIEISEEVFNEFLSKSANIALTMIRTISASLRSSDQANIADLSRKNIELAKAYEDLKTAQGELVKKERLERELEIAGEVQRSLLPSRFPATPGYSFYGRNVPARHVGGDLYDVIKVDDEHVGVLMADVSDKGVHAALIMAVTRTLFLALARRIKSPSEVAIAVHNGILEVSSDDNMFVTVFYGVLNLATGVLRYIRAGQDKPLLFRAEGGPPERLDAEGRFLGMLPGLTLEERETQLRPGDLLATYSDGVTDAVNLRDENYDLERLINLIEQHRAGTAKEVCQAIFDDVFRFRGAAPAFDDITVLVGRYDKKS